MIADFKISYVYTTCNLEHSSTTFALQTLCMMSEENGRHANMVLLILLT